MRMNMTTDECMIWDEVYRKTYEETANSEYATMIVANPQCLKDDVLSFADAFAKERAAEAATEAVLNSREKGCNDPC